MSIEYFLTQLNKIYGKEPFWIPTLFLILILSGIFCFRQLLKEVLQHYPKYYKHYLIISFLGFVILLYNYFIWKNIFVCFSGFFIMILSLSSIFLRYSIILSIHLQNSWETQTRGSHPHVGLEPCFRIFEIMPLN